jgi:hypothetical protein
MQQEYSSVTDKLHGTIEPKFCWMVKIVLYRKLSAPYLLSGRKDSFDLNLPALGAPFALWGGEVRDCKPASLRDFANWVQQVVREQIVSLGYGKTGSSATPLSRCF